MRGSMFASVLACLFLVFPGSSQADDNITVNLMINADVPPLPSERQGYDAEAQLKTLYTEISGREIGATVFPTIETLGSYVRTRITRIGKDSRFELAMSGGNSTEMMSQKSFARQSDILEKSKLYTEACKYCGINEINVTGFMPPSFDQNADTHKIIDKLGLSYDAGYQSGIIYEPGHEKDVWPYKVEGYEFYAVPVSTYTLSGDLVPLHDKYFNDSGFSAAQWYDSLVGKLEEAKNNNQPMVIVLTSSVSGSGEYLSSLKKFLDYAKSNKASFVTTERLVEMAKAGVHDVSKLPVSGNESAICTTCRQENSFTISVTAAGNKSNNTEV